MMTPLEIISFIVAIMILLKCILIIIQSKWTIPLSEQGLKNPKVLIAIYLVAFLIIGYFVLQEVSITGIVAVMALSAILFKMEMIANAKEALTYLKQIHKKKTNWFVVIIMIIAAAVILLNLFDFF